MKKIRIIFLILSYIAFFAGCMNNLEKNSSFESTVLNMSGTNTTQNTGKNFSSGNYMLNDEGKILIMCGDGYEPYTYNKFPKIPEKLAQIIKILSEGENTIELNNTDKLYLYYQLEENKCRIIGGNGVDIFNFSIDKELDIITFSIENLTFNGELDDDYSPQLRETFNILFGVAGEDIFHYFMALYEHPTDGVTDETMINGMQITYKCTPKHRLAIYMVADK